MFVEITSACTFAALFRVLQALPPQPCLLYRYIAMTSAALILGFGLSSKPETSMMVWAKRQAKKELDAEGA